MTMSKKSLLVILLLFSVIFTGCLKENTEQRMLGNNEMGIDGRSDVTDFIIYDDSSEENPYGKYLSEQSDRLADPEYICYNRVGAKNKRKIQINDKIYYLKYSISTRNKVDTDVYYFEDTSCSGLTISYYLKTDIFCSAKAGAGENDLREIFGDVDLSNEEECKKYCQSVAQSLHIDISNLDMKVTVSNQNGINYGYIDPAADQSVSKVQFDYVKTYDTGIDAKVLSFTFKKIGVEKTLKFDTVFFHSCFPEKIFKLSKNEVTSMLEKEHELHPGDINISYIYYDVVEKQLCIDVIYCVGNDEKSMLYSKTIFPSDVTFP